MLSPSSLPPELEPYLLKGYTDVNEMWALYEEDLAAEQSPEEEPEEPEEKPEKDSSIRPRIGDGVADERNSLPTLPFRTARQIAEEEPEETTWTARGYLGPGLITELDGKIKTAGKTTFMSHMVGAILKGKPFIGAPTVRTPVVYLTEQTPSSFRQVLERAELTGREDVHVLHWHAVATIRWHDVVSGAVAYAEEVGAGVLIVDTIAQFAGLRGDAENNAGSALEAMRPLQEAAGKGLAVLFTRHDRKSGGEVGESARGSSAFGGAVDIILSLRRAEGNVRETVRELRSLSRFDETPDKLAIELGRGGYRALGDSAAFSEQTAFSTILEALPATEENAIETSEVVDRLTGAGIGRTVVAATLTKLADAGTIQRTGKGKKGDPYRYYKPVLEDPDIHPGGSNIYMDEYDENPIGMRIIHSSATPSLGCGRMDERKNGEDGETFRYAGGKP